MLPVIANSAKEQALSVAMTGESGFDYRSLRMCACACVHACACNELFCFCLSSCHYKEKVNGINGLAMTGRVSLTRHARHYDRDRLPSPSVHTALALAQFPTPARQTRSDGLRVIPSAPEAPTRLPDAPCGREVGV